MRGDTHNVLCHRCIPQAIRIRATNLRLLLVNGAGLLSQAHSPFLARLDSLFPAARRRGFQHALLPVALFDDCLTTHP